MGSVVPERGENMLAEIILAFIVGVIVGVVGLIIIAIKADNKKHNKNITKTEK